MKKSTILLTVVVVVAVAVGVFAGGEKVAVCHIPDVTASENLPVTVNVSEKSAEKHLAHGDTLGACGAVEQFTDSTVALEVLQAAVTNDDAEQVMRQSKDLYSESFIFEALLTHDVYMNNFDSVRIDAVSTVVIANKDIYTDYGEVIEDTAEKVNRIVNEDLTDLHLGDTDKLYRARIEMYVTSGGGLFTDNIEGNLYTDYNRLKESEKSIFPQEYGKEIQSRTKTKGHSLSWSQDVFKATLKRVENLGGSGGGNCLADGQTATSTISCEKAAEQCCSQPQFGDGSKCLVDFDGTISLPCQAI